MAKFGTWKEALKNARVGTVSTENHESGAEGTGAVMREDDGFIVFYRHSLQIRASTPERVDLLLQEFEIGKDGWH